MARLNTNNIRTSGKVRLYAWHIRDQEKDEYADIPMTYRMDIVNKGCDISVKFTPHSQVKSDADGNKWTDLNNWLEYSCNASSSDLQWYNENYPSLVQGNSININIDEGDYRNLFVKRLENESTVGIIGELDVSAASSGFIDFDIIEYAYWGEKREDEIQSLLNYTHNLSIASDHARGIGNANIEVTSDVISVNNLPGENIAKGIGLGSLSLINNTELREAWENAMMVNSAYDASTKYNEGLYGVDAKIHFKFRNDTGTTSGFDIIMGSGGGSSYPIIKMNSIGSSGYSTSNSDIGYATVPAQKIVQDAFGNPKSESIQGFAKMMTVPNVPNGKEVTLEFDMFFPAGGSSEYAIAVLKEGVWENLAGYSYSSSN